MYKILVFLFIVNSYMHLEANDFKSCPADKNIFFNDYKEMISNLENKYSDVSTAKKISQIEHSKIKLFTPYILSSSIEKSFLLNCWVFLKDFENQMVADINSNEAEKSLEKWTTCLKQYYGKIPPLANDFVSCYKKL